MRLERTDALLFRGYLLSNVALLVLTTVWASTELWGSQSVLAGAWYATAGFGVFFMLWLAIGYARDTERESLWLAFRESAD